MRWSANFTPALEELGCKITYAVDKEGRNKVLQLLISYSILDNKSAGHSQSGKRRKGGGSSLEGLLGRVCG